MRIKAFLSCAAIACVASLAASSAFAQEYKYVGPSKTTHDGNDGLFTMHEACRDTFGSNAIMCTSEMLIEGGRFATAPKPDFYGEWVNPIVTSAVFLANGLLDAYVDISGREAPRRGGLNCANWATNEKPLDPPSVGTSTTGLSISAGPGYVGIFGIGFCNVERAVACCSNRRK